MGAGTVAGARGRGGSDRGGLRRGALIARAALLALAPGVARMAAAAEPGGAGSEAQEVVLETRTLVERVIEKLEGWVVALVEMLPNLAVALVLVVFFGLLARLAGRLVHRALQRTAGPQVTSLAGVATRLAVAGTGLFVALGVLQLEKTVTSLLAGVGVVGLALSFAFQDIASNFMSGVILAFRKPFDVGDLVQTHDQMGWIRRVTLRATVLRNFSGQDVIIPNRDVLQNPIINYVQSGERRVEVPVGVSYADDLEAARDAARRAAESLERRDPSRDVSVIYTGFGASSIDMEVRFWLDLSRDDADYLEARSDAVIAIQKAFDEAGLTIPFPIRTLDLGGVVGGPGLAEALEEGLGGRDGGGGAGASHRGDGGSRDRDGSGDRTDGGAADRPSEG